ncbi:MAG: EamA family transporter [Gemmatimonadota bacterium]|jgi:drug/metabolite transporter (DMT)-like permease
MTSDERRIRFGLVALTFIWGLNFALVKGVLPGVPPLAFNALRFPVAALAIALFLLPGGPVKQGMRRPEPGDVVPIIFLSLLGNVAYQLLFIVGLDLTRAGNASLFLSTIPAWTALLAVGFGSETVTGRQWLGIAGALGGAVLLVIGGQGIALEGATLIGDLTMVAAALSWAGFTVASRPYIQKYGPVPFAAWSLWIATPILIVMGIPELRAIGLGSLGWVEWGVVVYAGALSISLAFVLWNLGVRLLGNAQTAIHQNVVPVVTLAAAWPLLGEVPAGVQLAGAALILASVRLARRGAQSAPEGRRAER